MLSGLPTAVACLFLMLVGAAIAAFINWAIFSWAMFERRAVSPWMRRTPEETAALPPVTWLDRVPLIGWWRLRRLHVDEPSFGKWLWIRSLAIEVTWIIGLPWFFHWQTGGGLIGLSADGLLPIAGWAGLAETWFWCHTILLAWMFIATFIDFDERTIPDQITVPGTLVGLTIAAIFPWSRLPELGADAGGATVAMIHFRSPEAVAATHWCFSTAGLALAIGVLTVWVLALLPRISPWHLGVRKCLQITWASILRPRRKTVSSLRTVHRQPFGATVLLALVWLVAIPTLVAAWALLPSPYWLSLISAIMGLAVGGGIVWGIRIVGSAALGQQAMGFGDVTLMAMIGAYLGWQATLAAFIYGIMAAVLVVMVLMIVTRDSHLAFGPYLCIGAVMSMFWWESTWTSGRLSLFALGPYLLALFAVSLVLMAVLLPMVRWLRVRVTG